MTDKQHAYDPDLPYVVEVVNEPYARFKRHEDASRYTKDWNTAKIIDTTPKPRVPEDAKFITWLAMGSRYFAELDSDGSWYCRQDSQAEALEDLPGVTPETTFTVLEPREAPELMAEQMRDGDGSHDR